METNKFTFAVGHEGLSPGDLIMSLLSGKAPRSPEDCACNECTAERMLKDPPSNRAATVEEISDLAKRALLKLLKSAQRASDACGAASALIVERPTCIAFDYTMLLHRVESYNATVRACQTLATLIPEPAMTAELRDMLPTPVSWERALEMLEKQRTEVLAIVREAKARTSVRDVGVEAARIVGSEIAKVIKDATRSDNPRTEDEIKAIIEAAAERAKSAIRDAAERTPTYPPPPPAEQATP